MQFSKKPAYRLFPWLFVICRLALLIAQPLDGLRGFGDFVHFYRLAGMGIPYLDFWVEFPPVFPFFSLALYNLAGGVEHIYDYLLVIFLTLAQAISLAFFIRISEKIFDKNQAQRRIIFYSALLLVLAYGWWYFDPFAELAMMLGIYWTLEGRDGRAGLVIGIGTLTKLFPALLLPMIWRYRPARGALVASGISLGLVFGAYTGLSLLNPEMTSASIRSQASKGSWETIWALVDGNFQTGNFGPESERYTPETASLPRGNPLKLPSWLTLFPFLAIGFWAFRKAKLDNFRQGIAFLGFTWTLFLLWSPGWSPQWVLYLLPMIMLALPEREANLLTLGLVFINLLEWPVLLSRGYSLGLWLTIPLRTILLALMSILFLNLLNRSKREAGVIIEY